MFLLFFYAPACPYAMLARLHFLFFQVGHLFIPGSSTKELMLLVDACETINESMVQLIFQVSIILASNLDPTGTSQPITTLQILVLVKTFIMASKGPAEDFLAAKMRRLKNNQGSKEEKEATTEEPGTKDKTLAKKSDKGCERKQTKGKNEETPSDKEQDDQDGKAVRHEPDPNKTFNQCHCIKTEVEYYHEMGIGKKLRMIGKRLWN